MITDIRDYDIELLDSYRLCSVHWRQFSMYYDCIMFKMLKFPPAPAQSYDIVQLYR